MHAGFETHSTEHWHPFIKCGLKKKRNNSQEDNKHFANAVTSIGSVSHHAAYGPLPQGASHWPLSCSTPGSMSLGSLWLPSKVTPVTSWSLLSESWMSPGQAARNHPTYSCPGQAFGLQTIFTFRLGIPRQPLYFSKKWFPLYPSCVLFLMWQIQMRWSYGDQVLHFGKHPSHNVLQQDGAKLPGTSMTPTRRQTLQLQLTQQWGWA